VTLVSRLLGKSSPYIFNLVYDIDVRLLFIEFLNDPSDEKPSLRIIFPEISMYSEANQAEFDDDELMDDLVSLEQISDSRIIILTCKKEITIELAGKPFAEKLTRNKN
jgi:hypothetical protein|tara:strand:- start:2041 stop:2364 length:324 start_codon:yes stop_codon:yes gene_type:complete